MGYAGGGMTVAERVRALRERVGISQGELARRSGLKRVEVNQIENGANQAGSWNIRAGLARGIGVDVVALAAYIDGEIGLGDVFEKRIVDMPVQQRPSLLENRPEWEEALAAARSAALVSDPDLGDDDWRRVGQLHDGPSLPARVTPRLILQLARTLHSA